MSVKWTISGTVNKVTPRRTFGKNDTQAVQLILDIGDGSFQQIRAVDFIGAEACERAESLHAGDKVTVEVKLRGREWNGKYFNTDEAVDVSVTQDAPVEEADDDLGF